MSTSAKTTGVFSVFMKNRIVCGEEERTVNDVETLTDCPDATTSGGQSAMSSPSSVSKPSDAVKENLAVRGNAIELVQPTVARTCWPTGGNADGTTETDNESSKETNVLIRSDVQSSSSERAATTALHSNVSEAPEKAEYTEQGTCRDDVRDEPEGTAFVETLDSTSPSLRPLCCRDETKNDIRYVFALAESFVMVADQRRSLPNGTCSSKSKPTRVPSE